MNKTITIYELLGLIKDGKAPKKIKLTWNNEIWYWNDYDSYVAKESLKTTPDAQIYLFDQYRLFFKLDTEVEILDEEDEFIEIEEDNTILRIDDITPPYDNKEFNFAKQVIIYQKLINQLIHNQKILIERLENDK